MFKTKKIFVNILSVFCIVSLISCSGNKEDENEPEAKKTVEQNIEPLDYSKEENWVDIQKCGVKPVDVFFIYPTIIEGTENADGFASFSEMKEAAVVDRYYQASVYDESCNLYMPYYRQASMTLANECNKDNAAYLDILYKNKPYADITAALDYYFEHFNNGKPFILASHSQGSAMSINVLTHYMQEHKDYLARMVAAYVIGYAPSEDIFNETTGLKFATCEDDTNVVISFNTEGANASGKSILLPDKPMIINPLTWTTDDTYGSISLNKGSLIVSPNYDSFTLGPGQADAQINLKRKTLVCTTRDSSDFTDAPEAFATESFHEKEYMFYYANLQENVKTRVEAYLAKNSN